MSEMSFNSGTARFRVEIPQTGESFICAVEEDLLRAMSKLGRRGIPAGCLNGGCGICKVRILNGRVRETGPISRAHVSVEEASAGITLACRVAPESNIELEVMGKMQKPFLARFAQPEESV